jgi:hypothetical protein
MTEQTEKNILGRKKLRLDSLLDSIKAKDSKVDNKVDEGSDSEDQELNRYKSLISGKLNLKNISASEDSWTPDMYKKKNNVVAKPKTTSKTEAGELLNLLPMPKKKLMDNSFVINKPKVFLNLIIRLKSR